MGWRNSCLIQEKMYSNFANIYMNKFELSHNTFSINLDSVSNFSIIKKTRVQLK